MNNQGAQSMTRKTTLVRVTLCLATSFVLAGWLVGTPVVATNEDGADQTCRVNLDPSTVKPGQEAIEVMAIPSVPIGSLVSADIEGESAVGVEVVQAERGDRGDYALSLNVLSASAGTWSLTLHGVHGDCTGTLYVETSVASRSE
jgi:hypothetical protein